MEDRKELQRKLSHVNSIIDVLRVNAWVGEKSPIGRTEIMLEHDTKNRMLTTMLKYRDALERAMEEQE